MMGARRDLRLGLAGPLALVLLLVPVGLAPAAARAQSVRALFDEANAAYFRGDFAGAAAGYERLLAAGVYDADVLFNAGNAHARSGALGRAVLDFERCLQVRAGDDGCEAALSTAQSELGRLRAARAGEATVRSRPPLSHAIVRQFSTNLLAGLLLFLDFALFAMLLGRRVARAESLRLGLSIAAPLTALLLCTTALGLLVKTNSFEAGPPGIVLSDTPLLEGPDPRAKSRGRALEGERATLAGAQGGYLEAVLEGERRGWVKASDLGRIRSD